MDHPVGADSGRAERVDFDPRVRLEFRGTQLSSDGGFLLMRELDDALGLSDLAAAAWLTTFFSTNAYCKKNASYDNLIRPDQNLSHSKID